MNPQQVLASIYDSKSKPQITAKATDLVRYATLCYAWFSKLLLPILTPEQRLKMMEAGLAGMPQFIAAYQGLLQRSPRLLKALGLKAGYLDGIRQMFTSLVRVNGRADAMDQQAQDGLRLVLDQMKELNDRLIEAATRVADDLSADAEQRRQARGLVDFAGGFRQKRQATKQVRKGNIQRKVARATHTHDKQIATQDAMALKKALGTGKADMTQAPPPPPPSPAPTKAAPHPKKAAPPPQDELVVRQGAPLDTCLNVPAALFDACATDLDKQKEEAGIPILDATQRASLTSADYLLEGDLTMLLAGVLPGLRWLQKEADVTPDQLDPLCGTLRSMVELGKASGLLLQGASDGLLVLGSLVLIVHQQASSWVRRQKVDPKNPDQEILRLRLEIDGAHEVLQRSKERQAASTTRTGKKIGDIQQATEAAMAQAEYDQTIDQIQAEKDVPAEQVYAAKAHKQRMDDQAAERAVAAKKQAEAAPARKGSRKTPRTLH